MEGFQSEAPPGDQQIRRGETVNCTAPEDMFRFDRMARDP